MEFHGILWEFPGMSWNSMAFHKILGNPMNFHEILWNSMGIPWICIEFHGDFMKYYGFL